MRLIFSFVLVGAGIFTGCVEREHAPDRPGIDSIAVVTGLDSSGGHESDTLVIDSAFAGYYMANAICKGCDGSKQTLLLRENGSFKLQDQLPGNSSAPHISNGNWSLVNQNIVLFSNQMVIAKYLFSNDSLLTLERQGTILSDSSSRLYALQRIPDAASNEGWSTVASKGVQLYIIGNEPFWNIEISDSNKIMYKRAGSSKRIRFPASIARIGDTTYYRGNHLGDTLQIVILPYFCNDGMSDRLYEYAVRLHHNGQLLSGCGVYFRNDFK